MSSSQGICGTSWVIDIGKDDSNSNLISLIAVNSLNSIITIFLNLSAIVIIWRLEQVPGSSRILLLSLSFTDLLTGMISQPIFITFMSLQVAGKNICILAKIATFVGLTLWVASFSTLVLASIERYLCIFYPFIHERINASNMFAVLLASFWVTGLLMASLFQIEGIIKELSMIAAMFNAAGCLIMALVYIRVYYLAQKVRREIRDQAQSVGNQSDHSSRSANMIAIIVALSLISYIPYGVAVYIDSLSDLRVAALLFDWFWTLVMANSTINPICYCLLNKSLRKRTFDLWRNWKDSICLGV